VNMKIDTDVQRLLGRMYIQALRHTHIHRQQGDITSLLLFLKMRIIRYKLTELTTECS
jgi:hypothetical protein